MLLIFVVQCQDTGATGATGIIGPRGPVGETGPKGEPGKHYVWPEAAPGVCSADLLLNPPAVKKWSKGIVLFGNQWRCCPVLY